jgi:organic radical activating enzyme
MKNSAFYKPNTVQIELVQGCNRHCTFCGTMGIEKKIHPISKSVLTRQCELIQNSGYNPRVLLAGHGEPTLHPKFFSCIKLMRKLMPRVSIKILTNGYSINKDINNIITMFESGINDLTIDEYFDSKFNQHEIQELLKKYESKTGIHVEFAIMGKGVPLYMDKNPNKKRLLICPAIELSEVSSSRKLTNHCGAGMPPDDKLVNSTCTRIFREMVFRWDGWVSICCQDFRGQFPIVNCMNKDINIFDDIWRHERFEAARRILYHDKRAFFPCNICNLVAMRPGLLPDHLGKESMEEPTESDYELVKSVSKMNPLAKTVKREWET